MSLHYGVMASEAESEYCEGVELTLNAEDTKKRDKNVADGSVYLRYRPWPYPQMRPIRCGN